MKPSVWDKLHPEGGEEDAESMGAIYSQRRAAGSCLSVHAVSWPHEWHTIHNTVATLAALLIWVNYCTFSWWKFPMGRPSSPHLWRLHRSRKGEPAVCPSSGLCCENTHSGELWDKKNQNTGPPSAAASATSPRRTYLFSEVPHSHRSHWLGCCAWICWSINLTLVDVLLQ